MRDSCGIINNDKGKYHTVVWLNYDNSLLYKDTKVVEGEMPVYKGETPTKPKNEEYSYAFVGWSPDVVPAYINATYVARYSICYDLSVTSEDDNKGTASIISGRGILGETIVVEATPTNDYAFYGWYQGLSKVSDDLTYSFEMPNSNYSLVAKFITQTEALELGLIPVIDDANQALTYGLYPQKNVDDSALITSLNALTTPESNGWYLYNNEYYAKLIADPFDKSYVFDNGTTIVKGTTYWFKCEPITWNILSNNNGEYYLLSSTLLDAHRFDDDSNNYKDSEIRAWLNNEFYNSAFAFNSGYIKTTNVDNSASTTHSNSNPNVCENTQDKVFLPSYKDYLNESYGFTSSTNRTELRECKTTDWTRAKGTWNNYNYTGGYCTRSPDSGNRNIKYVWEITESGQVLDTGDLNDSTFNVSYTRNGVRPAIILSVKD